jgi:hypothetical protein
MECSDSLAVEAKVLGEGLTDKHLEAPLHKVADGVYVLLQAISLALVGKVKRGISCRLFMIVAKSRHCSFGEICGSGIMVACLENEYTSLGCAGDNLGHALPIFPAGLGSIVLV